MKIWLDDIRTPDYNEDDYVWIKSVKRAIELISLTIKRGFDVEKISLDHDMGDTFGGDAIGILQELERLSHRKEDFAAVVKNITFKIHTANPVGAQNMRDIIQYNGWREV